MLCIIDSLSEQCSLVSKAPSTVVLEFIFNSAPETPDQSRPLPQAVATNKHKLLGCTQFLLYGLAVSAHANEVRCCRLLSPSTLGTIPIALAASLVGTQIHCAQQSSIDATHSEHHHFHNLSTPLQQTPYRILPPAMRQLKPSTRTMHFWEYCVPSCKGRGALTSIQRILPQEVSQAVLNLEHQHAYPMIAVILSQ